jgi:hypothetical protein
MSKTLTEYGELAFIEEKLKALPEVIWDRYAGKEGNWCVYGWIDRADAYKDFIVVEFAFPDEGDPYWWFATSSAKHSALYSEVLGLGKEHTDCRRAETVFPSLPTVRQKRLSPTAQPSSSETVNADEAKPAL